MKTVLFLFSYLFLPACLFAQINGTVFDAVTRLPLHQVKVSSADTHTFSDSKGLFSLPVQSVENTPAIIKVSYPLYQDTSFTINKTNSLVIYLKPRYISLKEVEVNTANSVSRYGTEAARLGRKELESISKPLGETDLIKALQLRPGILQTGETQSGLYIRGGNSAQTAILLQGVPIFNSAHLLGLNSTLDPDAYESVTLATGGFSAREGGWLSAYLQAEPRARGVEKNQVKLGVGVLSSEASFQGHNPRYKTSVFLKAKSSYYQLLAKAYQRLLPEEESTNSLPDYAFSDYNLQTHTKLRKGSLSLTLFGSQDKYDGTTDRFSLASGWGNRLVSARWRRTLGPAWLELTQGYSRYAFSMEHQRQEKDLIDQTTYGYFSNLLIGAPISKVGFIEAGTFLQQTQATVHSSQQDKDNRLLAKNNFQERLTLGGAFTEAQFTIKRFTTTGGTRVYKYNKDLLLAPRAKIQFSEGDWAASIYYDRTYQFHHQVNILGVNMPFDFVRFASDKLPVQQSDQLGLSLNKQIKNHRILTGVYHRWLDGQLFYSNGTVLLRNFDMKFDSQAGRAYGLELEHKASFNTLSLTTGYTLAYSKLAMLHADATKQWVYPIQDARHQVNTGLELTLNKHWQFTAQWFLQTGTPYTFPLSIIPAQGMTPGEKPRLIPYFEQFNNVRTPIRHRLDIGATYKKQHQKSLSEWHFGLYNVYNHANPYFLYFDVERQEDGTGKIIAKQRSLLPLTPTIRYTCSFDL